MSLAVGASARALAADTMMPMAHGAMTAPDAAAAPLTQGQVKKLDKGHGTLTVAQDRLPNGMPAMTMMFRVKDHAWLERVKENQKTAFAVETLNGTMTIVRLEAAK
ncbi:copper-binding protein [uncultured Thiodictyon sp.]|uniref:copper-binding protein n=1 Tax=uncultured Thiodictyon sp. TaxID=1846217 RepID=UPI0025FB1910|nr:copper-binding protein [uncultured Thiodictyon sp.]